MISSVLLMHHYHGSIISQNYDHLSVNINPYYEQTLYANAPTVQSLLMGYQKDYN